jgi:hypothetical protein
MACNGTDNLNREKKLDKDREGTEKLERGEKFWKELFHIFSLHYFNLLKPNGNHVYHVLYQSVTAFRIYGSCVTLSIKGDYFLKQR